MPTQTLLQALACLADQVGNLRQPVSSNAITAHNLVYDLPGAQTFHAGLGAILGEVAGCLSRLCPPYPLPERPRAACQTPEKFLLAGNTGVWREGVDCWLACSDRLGVCRCKRSWPSASSPSCRGCAATSATLSMPAWLRSPPWQVSGNPKPSSFLAYVSGKELQAGTVTAVLDADLNYPPRLALDAPDVHKAAMSVQEHAQACGAST